MMIKMVTSIAVLLAALSTVNCQWRHLGNSKLDRITTSPNWIWGTRFRYTSVRCERPLGDPIIWHGEPMGPIQLSAGDDEVWAVFDDKTVMKRPVDGSSRWQEVSGLLTHVSASGNGFIWGAYEGQAKMCKKPCNGEWIDLPDLNVVEVDAGNAYVYALDENSRLFSLPVNAVGPGWRFIPGVEEKFTHVTGSGSDVFVTTEGNNLYRCKKPCIGEWELMATDKVQCDATFDSIVCLDSEGIGYQLLTA